MTLADRFVLGVRLVARMLFIDLVLLGQRPLRHLPPTILGLFMAPFILIVMMTTERALDEAILFIRGTFGCGCGDCNMPRAVLRTVESCQRIFLAAKRNAYEPND